jgi:hypothetical protein
MANKKDAEREIAWMKFLHEGKTRQQIAEELDVAVRTVNTWAAQGSWEEKREMMKNSDGNTAIEITGYIHALLKAVGSREEDKRFPTPSEADSLNKLLVARERLVKGIMLPQLYEASVKILNYVQTQDLKLAQALAPVINVMLKEEAARYEK